MNYTQRDLGTLRKGEIIGGLLYWPMYLLGSQVLAVLIAKALGADLDSETVLGLVNFIFGLLNLLFLVPIFFRYLRDQFRRLQDRGWGLFGDLALGFVVYYGLSLAGTRVISILLELLGVEYSNLNEEAVEAAVEAAPWMTILLATVLAPITEELLCRGLIFCGLYRRSRIWAYALSMLVFSLLHVYGSMLDQPFGVSLVNLVVYLPAGFALAWSYERSGSIFSAMILHTVINTSALLLQALAAQL